MPDWVPWLIVAGVLGLAELHSLTLVLGMLSVAALPAAIVAALGAGAAWQVLVFAAAAGLLLAVIRPVAQRHRRQAPGLRTGTAALVGKRATAVTAIDDDGGRVRIGGEVWSARSYTADTVIPEGAAVDVIGIDGATAVVLAIDTLATET